MNKTNWLQKENENLLIAAVQENRSIAGVLKTLGLAPKGGNYRTIKYHITRLGIDTSHHTGQGWKREDYDKPNSRHTKVTIRARLIRESGHTCWSCGLSEWMGKPIPLEMDHIDGNSQNNDESNLRILCANCHSQTPTFRNSKRKAPLSQ